MVLPAANSKHIFNVTGTKELRERLKMWIRQNYSDILGPEVNMLDLPNGFELIETKLHRLMRENGMKVPELKTAGESMAA